MKIKNILIGAFCATGLAASASAQSVINITGATAFREAAHQAIRTSLDAGYTFGYTGTNINNASSAIFKGTINSGADAVTVRTSWSGSVAGIRAIVNQANSVSYQPSASVNYNLSPSGTGILTTGGTPNLVAASQGTTANSIAFADNTQDNTPFGAVNLSGGPIGVIAFVPVVNDTTLVTEYTTNVTSLQLRRLITQGDAPLQFITGNSADAGRRVYYTGRQDTSGTRAIYLTEMGLPTNQPVNQWRVEPLNNDAVAPVTAIRLWPTGDTNNASTIFGSDTAGNGGYASGGALAPVMQRTSSSGVTVLSAANAPLATNQNVVLLTVLSSQEANDIQIGGGKVLSYNSSYIAPEALPTGLNTADKNKIAKGQYTLWSYENLYYRDDISNQPTLDLIALLETNVPLSIAGNGVKISDMFVSRQKDGGSLTVSSSLP